MKAVLELRKDRKGFTLIEIVIVLAIAALILVIVFLAVGGAQRSQRDNASVTGAGRVIAAYQAYLSDNGNTAPADGSKMGNSGSGYLQGVKDGRGNEFEYTTIDPVVSANSKSYYVPKGRCSTFYVGALDTANPGGDTQVAVFYWSENAAKKVCKQN